MRDWKYGFLLHNLIARDFKIRYRNMSLGVFWSLLNPLIMMMVLTFVFTRIFAVTSIENFYLFVLTGLVPYNFFSLAWSTATTSIIDNASLVKKVRCPREVLPVSTVLANSIHFLIQLGLVLGLVLVAGYGVNRHWIWLPVVLGLEIVFVCGLSLVSAGLDVRFRDVRYIVESSSMILFWLVPIFYSFASISPQYRIIYQFNPIAAVVLACRQVLLEAQAPADTLLSKLAMVSAGTLFAGLWVFRRLQRSFADYL
jgi:ABC-type polysaccharide/polyol phosphate export permease